MDVEMLQADGLFVPDGWVTRCGINYCRWDVPCDVWFLTASESVYSFSRGSADRPAQLRKIAAESTVVLNDIVEAYVPLDGFRRAFFADRDRQYVSTTRLMAYSMTDWELHYTVAGGYCRTWTRCSDHSSFSVPQRGPVAWHYHNSPSEY